MFQSNYMDILKTLYHVIFNLKEEYFDSSIQQTMKLFDSNYPYSFNLLLSSLIYCVFYSQKNIDNIYLDYLKIIQTKEEELDKNYPKIIEIFLDYIRKINTQETYYIINKMLENNLIDINIIENFKLLYFVHYDTKEENKDKYSNNLFYNYFIKNYEDLKKNDWELHKKYVKEGHNPNEIAKIIRNDEIEKLQEISSQSDFDFNQTIKPSLYERCSFINQKVISLIKYAAFFGSVKCFKYLLMNGANTFNAGKYAIAGGNLEIIHFCEQNHSSFKSAYETAIKFHQNDIFKYIYENKLEKLNENLFYFCVNNSNYEILLFLEEEGMKIDKFVINETAKIGNLFLTRHFLEYNQIPTNIIVFASESGNIELVKYVLKQDGVDINSKDDYNGRTALMSASENSHKEIVKLLLKQGGIDVNAKNRSGKTALMMASYEKNIDIVKLLLDNKEININDVDKKGWNALFYASYKGNTEIVKLLLKQKEIDVNAKDKFGYTALMKAAFYDHRDIVKLLLEHEGIDATSIDKDENIESAIADNQKINK